MFSAKNALSLMARRRMAQAPKQQKRNMALGGSHEPPPEWTGIDKVVRGYFPHDYQLSAAILGTYFGIGFFFYLKGKLTGKKAEPEPAPAPVKSSSVSMSGVPAVDSPEFPNFIESDSFLKLLENEDQLVKTIESA